MAARQAPRRLDRRHLPFVVHRRGWAQGVTLIVCAALLVLPALMITAAFKTGPDPVALLFVSLLSALFLLATVIGIDRSIGYRLILDADGFTTKGLLFTRQFRWEEVTGFVARANFRLPGYYASWSVDGSNHPRHHWSSLWFGFYEVPPLMAYGGKELTRLLRHAKRRASAGWSEPAPRSRQKAE